LLADVPVWGCARVTWLQHGPKLTAPGRENQDWVLGVEGCEQEGNKLVSSSKDATLKSKFILESLVAGLWWCSGAGTGQWMLQQHPSRWGVFFLLPTVMKVKPPASQSTVSLSLAVRLESGAAA